MSVKKAYILAALGASLWGTIGLFVEVLHSHGFSSWEVVAIRLLFSALLLTVVAAAWYRTAFKVKLQHLPLFIGTGIISIAFFNYFFFTVMNETSVSISVVLLYSGPVFVVLLSRLFFKEPLTRKKLCALGFMVAGTAFVVEYVPLGGGELSPLIIVFGLASGFFYALYSIFGKAAGRYYDSMTITLYSMILGALFMVPASQLWQQANTLFNIEVLATAVGLGLVPTVLAYLLYTTGLRYAESGRVSILSAAEPVVAVLIGVFVFQDQLTGWQMAGIVLVIVSTVLTFDLKWKKKQLERSEAA
ncbi:threonine/homoserine efflux transporter RhtA [Salsuginibacillus halophilus]|uniref:Threonine/homoserine efflux transporter RhtA n=1 Tax=Salsuginibacillus halophilus TaxID=517424 RepID=A0A2P8HBL6_9BACI|nr:EamA family transporter [Salsuginibacillus halophilus]PSL43618.1 threonine/homoserine efflux transporter RhtA [Salsuginibacillus halophilus]